MSKNYAALAKQILTATGGADNIAAVTHCMTRLRFVVKDNARVDSAALKSLKGVLGVVRSDNQCQVIIGNTVSQAFREVVNLLPDDMRPAEPMKPAALSSFAALREEAKPLWEQGEMWFSELDRQLSEQDSALYGMASQQMRLFVSAASGRLRGGFLAAADAAVLGWVVPAVCRRTLNPEPLRHTIAGLPRCLSALGIQ